MPFVFGSLVVLWILIWMSFSASLARSLRSSGLVRSSFLVSAPNVSRGLRLFGWMILDSLRSTTIGLLAERKSSGLSAYASMTSI
jgi:hypothetical protein